MNHEEAQHENEGAQNEDEGGQDEGADEIQVAAQSLMLDYPSLRPLVQASAIPVININGLTIFQRLLSCLVYFATKRTEDPSITYSQLEQFCHNNLEDQVTPESVVAILPAQLQSFGIRKNFVDAVYNFSNKYH